MARAKPLAGGVQRNMNQRLIDLGNTAPEDAHDPNKLAGDLLVGILRSKDEAGSQPQIQALHQAHTDIRREPIARLEITSVNDLLVERTERRLRDRINTQNLRWSGAARGAGEARHSEPSEDRCNVRGDIRRLECGGHQRTRARRQPVLDLSAQTKLRAFDGDVTAPGPDPGVDPLLVGAVSQEQREDEQRPTDHQCGGGQDRATRIPPKVAQGQNENDAEVLRRLWFSHPYRPDRVSAGGTRAARAEGYRAASSAVTSSATPAQIQIAIFSSTRSTGRIMAPFIVNSP